MTTEPTNPPKDFRVFYKGTIVMVVLFFIYSIILGIMSGEEGAIFLIPFFGMLIIVPTVGFVFLLINIWGLIKYKQDRKRYREAIIWVTILIASASYLFFNITLP